MPFIEERLLDPAADTLLATLKKATKVANGRIRQRRIEKDDTSWKRFISRNRRKAEGKQEFRGHRSYVPSPLVKVAWWTDHIGRKHWRIVGKRSDWQDYHSARSAFHDWPLWHVYPEHVMLKERDNHKELI